MKTEINSMALYGSRARMDYDIYSDKDLLIVDDNFPKQFDLEKQFNDEGYSCAAYTFKKLQILSDRKTLFIQHLKQDAKILTDKNGRLQNLLNNDSPKENYNAEIEETIAYFNLLEFIPDTIEGIGWAFDVIAIGLRNYNILQLANHKIYEFSLPIILQNSQRIFNLSDDELATLIETRVAKKNYRSKKYDLLPKKSELLSAISIIEKRYGISINPILLSKNIFNEYAFKAVYSNSGFSAYQKLRMFEAFIMSSPTIKDKSIYEKCKRIIENPKFYAANFNNQSFIDDLLIEMTNGNEKKNSR